MHLLQYQADQRSYSQEHRLRVTRKQKFRSRGLHQSAFEFASSQAPGSADQRERSGSPSSSVYSSGTGQFGLRRQEYTESCDGGNDLDDVNKYSNTKARALTACHSRAMIT